ncbi:hypothetical protein ACTJK3_03170 [Pseudomonas sp. 22105]|jgi:hypothetical protein|uniref:hypothetical protein n=1 Tax=unclassified Pseudomonas TaxID=196821 RepID=UPI000D25BCB4|nr:hypothetical protein DBV33_25835 [Pseudomonas fluorescens]NKF27309.1 hypothetical protein [Pseudomonas sp. BG5]
MLKKTFAAALVTVALTSTAYADCPAVTTFIKLPDGRFVAQMNPELAIPVDVDPATASESEVRSLLFTAVRLKEKDDKDNARAVCQYEDGKKPSLLGASLVWKPGKPITPSGPNWKNDDCATKSGNVGDCPFQ